LLKRPDFIGIKTGITVTAGPCLATGYKFRDKIYVCVVLRAPKVSRRFKETRKLLAWTLEKLYKGTLTEAEEQKLLKLKKNNQELDSDHSEDEEEFNYESKATAEYRKRRNIINYEI
jgi:D-alanyl-D-alanine carboxypeptidase